jgi:hypothetical protein
VSTKAAESVSSMVVPGLEDRVLALEMRLGMASWAASLSTLTPQPRGATHPEFKLCPVHLIGSNLGVLVSGVLRRVIRVERLPFKVACVTLAYGDHETDITMSQDCRLWTTKTKPDPALFGRKFKVETEDGAPKLQPLPTPEAI